MKKIIKSFLVVLMGFLMSVNVMADVQQEKQNPDYTTDYYMIVESKAGGIDIYSLPDLSSSKLNDSRSRTVQPYISRARQRIRRITEPGAIQNTMVCMDTCRSMTVSRHSPARKQ